MRRYAIAVLPGDGIGAEVVEQALFALRTAGPFLRAAQLDLQEIPCGGRYYAEHGCEWAEGSFARCQAADAILLGAVGHVGADGKTVTRADGELAGYDVVIGTRMKLDLYANVRPVRLYPGVRHRIVNELKQVWRPEHVDFVVVRENTEDAYVHGSHTLERGGVVELVASPTIITRKGADRVLRFAFELARERAAERDRGGVHGSEAGTRRRSKVTCTDKANVIQAHRFFRARCAEIAREFPDVQVDYAYTDALTQWMIRDPNWFDVIVAPNFAGDVISDLGSALQGGMGLAAGANIGDRHAMFEPIHGSAPPLAGKNEANPLACLLATAMMLVWLGRRHTDGELLAAGAALESAVAETLATGTVMTPDIGGTATTSEVGAAVVAAFRDRLATASRAGGVDAGAGGTTHRS
ncbi:MAG: isocitrate/isopropylmalate dehydrogenase family protein [Candidatus Schekmanbacteria bacterium]|nr:isocitrate/isopropylmalate dehydrogenase family protein [Candidatus Schekmanbacteria bacterium]